MKLTHRPLSDRHWLRSDQDRKRSAFTATWSDTLDLLEREVYALQTRAHDDPVLMMDITEGDLRLDGQPRASARPATPAVALAFESVKGPLIFRCDRYGTKAWGGSMDQPWQHNVRAIALSLKALRDVDRYGATESGEQYTGFRAIGPGGSTAMPEAPMTRKQAAEHIAAAADPELRLGALSRVIAQGRMVDASIRKARRNTHPDNGGTAEAFQLVQDAAAVLEAGR